MRDNYKNLLLQKITGLSKEQLFLSPHPQPISQRERGVYDSYVERLNAGEPIEYILEQAEFYRHEFFVDKRVLIPRNDTEVMVEQALKTTGDIYIDIGTGSGCIPISVIKNIQNNFAKSYALDISKQALEVAEINIKKHNLEDRIELLESDLLEKILEKNIQNKHIIITANLPYIKQDDFDNMDETVYLHEPDLALYGGAETGFELYEKLIGQCQQLKKSGNQIILFIELGFDQKDICEEFLQSQNMDYQIFQDNGGINRCVKISI